MRKHLTNLVSVAIGVCFLLGLSTSVWPGEFKAFGPQNFTRETGKPVTVASDFSVLNPNTEFFLRAHNAGLQSSEGEFVSSSIIALNEAQVFGPESFNQTVELVETPVILQIDNTLEVGLRGKPGGVLAIDIVGIDNIAPNIQITEPPDGSSINTNPCAIVLNCSDDISGLDPDSLEISINGVDKTDSFDITIAGLSGSALGSIVLSEGTNVIEASVSDLAGNNSTTSATVTLLASLSVEAGLDNMNIDVGTSSYVAYSVNFEVLTPGLYHVIAEQTVSPNNGGITWTSDYPSGGWATNASISWVINEQVFGNLAGTYELTKKVTVLETGANAEVTILVNVLSGVDEPKLLPLGSVPGGISVSVPTEVIFTTTLVDTSLSPSQVNLEEVDDAGDPIEVLGQLLDNGTDGDLAADDLVYSGMFMVEEHTEGKSHFRAESVFPGLGTVYSEVYSLIVTHFPTELQSSDMSKAVVDPSTGEEILSNEVLVTFIEGTSADTIEAIVASIGGSIVGTIPGLGIYQVEIPDTGDETGVNDAINALLSHPEVVSAEANGIDQPDEVVPNDTKYSSQWGPKKIRADEAWVIARGSVTVAVIDSGVDYNHDDLSGKVIKGKDVADNDNDPMDGGSHGTHVAGIIAAGTNNGKGIAGISWGSKILAVKVSKDSGGGITHADFEAGVTYAADYGAKIINYSNSGSASTQKHDAVKYATNKGVLFISTAGNKGNSTKRYPGGYSESFTVGNTTSTDGRAPTSNYGSWVNIAAPGDGILSTVPDNKYANKSGTSMAAPHVSGAAAVVWSRHPSWSAAKVRQRLEKSAKELPGLQLGHGRIDLFEAVFNGSFEIGDLSEWSSTGTTSSFTGFKTASPQIIPQHRKRMGYASTGPAGDGVAASLNQNFTIQSGITSLPITFDYTFVTEEYPEWVGTIYDDSLKITLVAPSGSEYTLAVESVNDSTFTSVSGIDFPGGDNTVGWTGWKEIAEDISVTEGSGTYKIYITDAGDDIYDSVLLIDNIRFKSP